MKFGDIYKIALKQGTMMKLNLDCGEDNVAKGFEAKELTSDGAVYFSDLMERDVDIEVSPLESENVRVKFEKGAAEDVGKLVFALYRWDSDEHKLYVFNGKGDHSAPYEVARNLFGSVLNLGYHRYAIMKHRPRQEASKDETEEVIYAWNDLDACKKAGIEYGNVI